MNGQPLSLPRNDVTPELLASLSANLRTVALIGPVGTGKTQLALAAAEYLHTTAFVFGCTPDSQASELIGSPLPNPDGSGGWLPFVPGPAMRAWISGGVLIIDDAHRAGIGITSALNIILNGTSAQFVMPDGTIARPHPDTRVFITMNGELADLDPDTRDRYRVRIPVMTPSQPMLDTLDARIRMLVELDYDGSTANPCGTFREWQSLSDLWPTMGLERAVLLALGSPERAYAMLDIMAKAGIPDASTAIQKIVGQMPRGYRP